MSKHIYIVFLVFVTAVAVLGALVAYSSANAVLWGVFVSQSDQRSNGTQHVEQLSSWRQDLASAWEDEVGPYVDDGSVQVELIEVPIELPIGLAIEKQLFMSVNGLQRVLVAVVSGCVGIGLAVVLACRFAASTRYTGLSEELLSSADVVAHQKRVLRGALWVVLIGMPIVSLASWYVFYDRQQSSWDDFANQPRGVRYIFESFRPTVFEWAGILGVMVCVVFGYVYFSLSRFVLSLPAQLRVEHQRFCPSRACRYPIVMGSELCPECGLGWRADVEQRRGVGIGKLVWKNGAIRFGTVGLIGSLVLIIAVIGVWGSWSTDRAWSWLSLREERYLTQSLYLVPMKPTRVWWGDNCVDLVIVPIDMDAPNHGVVAFSKINDLAIREIGSDPSEEQVFVEFDGARVAVLTPSFYPSRVVGGDVYCTIQVNVTPDRVMSYWMGDEMLDGVEAFFDDAVGLMELNR